MSMSFESSVWKEEMQMSTNSIESSKTNEFLQQTSLILNV
jgi:hypothetical protein